MEIFNSLNNMGSSFHGFRSYIAPEYVSAAILDTKNDVYSFGILVMEIVSGKTSVEQSVTEIEVMFLDLISISPNAAGEQHQF